MNARAELLYPSPVPAQLHVHTAESRAPERAARLITAELLRSFRAALRSIAERL